MTEPPNAAGHMVRRGAGSSAPTRDGRESLAAWWDRYCSRIGLADKGVPLFVSDPAGRVHAVPSGAGAGRGTWQLVLPRSAAAAALLGATADRVRAGSPSDPDAPSGLMYVLHWRQAPSGRIVPLHIGTVALAELRRATPSGRRTIPGDLRVDTLDALAAAACSRPAALPGGARYRGWATRLFEDAPAAMPTLRQPLFLWATAWSRTTPSPWRIVAPCTATFAASVLQAVAAELFPDAVLDSVQR